MTNKVAENKLTQCKILDTWQDFASFWTRARSKDVDEQVELWQSPYMEKYPELLSKQIRSYEESDVSWQEIAKKVIHALPDRHQLMLRARNNIPLVCRLVCAKAVENLKLDFDVLFVVYVGIGCGAGWATTYDRQPAVLLGLENIAEEKWHTERKLAGLISHEVGHLAHMKWRKEWEVFEEACEDPIFRLYSEGFAQRCEHLILGSETWHMAQNREWISWCRRHETWLAGEFLKRLRRKASVKDFFGSWFTIRGRSQTGYFLGHSFVRHLEKGQDLKKVALLDVDKVRKLGISHLESVSKQ